MRNPNSSTIIFCRLGFIASDVFFLRTQVAVLAILALVLMARPGISVFHFSFVKLLFQVNVLYLVDLIVSVKNNLLSHSPKTSGRTLKNKREKKLIQHNDQTFLGHPNKFLHFYPMLLTQFLYLYNVK